MAPFRKKKKKKKQMKDSLCRGTQINNKTVQQEISQCEQSITTKPRKKENTDNKVPTRLQEAVNGYKTAFLMEKSESSKTLK